MKRVTISMSDSAYEKISSYASLKEVSFSKACVHLASIGESSKTASDLTNVIMRDFEANNIFHCMSGNFNVPNSVIQRSISRSISGSNEASPLVEFAKIVGA
jgi:hypothetical protein